MQRGPGYKLAICISEEIGFKPKKKIGAYFTTFMFITPRVSVTSFYTLLLIFFYSITLFVKRCEAET